ncbi:MAG: rhodanese-like domain-containing protein [Planctomycetota bacterium]|jgi:rhodanese-related sulfurtransferase
MDIKSTTKAIEFFRARMQFTTGPVELSSMIQADEHINIIDVRRPDDFEKGHIPGAINLPEESWPILEGLNRDRMNIVYCYSTVCHLAAKACLFFAEYDYPVMELEGGFEEWHRIGLPVES